jgi:hypothetical protein
MSSSKSWIVKSVRHRLGWTLVIAGAALATTLVMGNSLIAAVIAIVIVVLLSTLFFGRERRTSGAEYPSERTSGGPYATSHAWKVDQKADLSEIVQALNDNGLALKQESESPNQVVLRGGSQLWTRLFGGYFVDPKRLPIEIELKAANGATSGHWTVQLGIQDRLGVGVRDEALEDRFAQAAGSIREVVGGQLRAVGGVEVDLTRPASQ